MHIVHVHVRVRPDCAESFREATVENASHSIREPGVARFDLLQEHEDPCRFVLLEVYRTPEDQERHRETEHYRKWRDRVADMMAEPRRGVKYANIFPDDSGWG